MNPLSADQKNVDTLASRTVTGKFLFEYAGISLHSIEGGEGGEVGCISNIITRWTLRVTVSVLPWKSTPRFSGILVHEVSSGGKEGVLVENLVRTVHTRKSENARAIPAGPEVPYQLLRRGNWLQRLPISILHNGNDSIRPSRRRIRYPRNHHPWYVLSFRTLILYLYIVFCTV